MNSSNNNKRPFFDVINFGASTSRDPPADIIDLVSSDDEQEAAINTVEKGEEKDVCIDDGRVDPDTVSVFENADVIRNFVEEIVKERAVEKGIMYELAGDKDNVCLVKTCANKAHPLPTARGFCRYHSSVGHKCIRLVNGRTCSTKGCQNKSGIFEDLCCRCYSLKTNGNLKELLEKETRKKENRWSKEKVLREAHDIASKYAEMVKKYPSTLVYFGITIRSLHIRLKEHLKSGKDFDAAILEIQVPDAHSLADLEFEVVARFSELAGGRHLRNRTAGGDYYLPDMDRPGVLYVLIFKGRVTSDTPTPAIDFRCRRGSHFRSFPIITRQRHIELPQFNRIVGIAAIMRKMGFDTNHNVRQATRHREEGHKCQQCDYVATCIMALETHMKVHRNKGKHKCHHCGHLSNRLEHLRLHLKTMHDEILPLAKRRKDEYPCDKCDEVFKTADERWKHKKRDHKEFLNCDICNLPFNKLYIVQHKKTVHGIATKNPKTDFQCSLCQQYLSTEGSLYMHVRRQHPEQKDDAHSIATKKK